MSRLYKLPLGTAQMVDVLFVNQKPVVVKDEKSNSEKTLFETLIVSEQLQSPTTVFLPITLKPGKTKLELYVSADKKNGSLKITAKIPEQKAS